MVLDHLALWYDIALLSTHNTMLWHRYMLYGLAYLLTMLRSNAGESIGLTKACSVSVRWQVGQTVTSMK